MRRKEVRQVRLKVVKYIVAVLRPELIVIGTASESLEKALAILAEARMIYPDAVLYEQLEFVTERG